MLTPEEKDLAQKLATFANGSDGGYGGLPYGYFNEAAKPNSENQKLLLSLVRSEDPKVALAALDSLGRINSRVENPVPFPAEQKQLLLGLMSHKDNRIAGAAAYITGLNNLLKGDKDVQALAEEICQEHTQPQVRAMGCYATLYHSLNFFNDADAQKAVYSALEDEDPFVISRVFDLVWSYGGSQGEPKDMLTKVETFFQSPDEILRGQAIHYALRHASYTGSEGEISKYKAIGIEMLKDKSAYVRRQAAVGLIWLKGWDTVETLLPLMEDKEKAEATYKLKTPGLSGDYPYVYYPSGSTTITVGDEVIYNLASKALGVYEESMKFSTPNITDYATTKADFMAWWTTHKEKLLTMK